MPDYHKKIFGVNCNYKPIGDFAPLDISIDESLFKKELKQYEDKWVPHI